MFLRDKPICKRKGNNFLYAIVLITTTLITPHLWADEMTYKWEKNDQWGIVLLSLGQEDLWGKMGAMEKIKHLPPRPLIDQLISLPTQLFNLHCNLRYVEGRVEIVKKLKSLKELKNLKEKCQRSLQD